MTTKTLIITPQGTAREINDMLPVSEYKEAFKVEVEGILSYQEAYTEYEASLKEYKIVGSVISEPDKMPAKHFNIQRKLIPGTTHQFSVNEEDKTCIIL